MAQSQTNKKEPGLGSSSEPQWIPRRYQHAAALLVILLSLVIFFRELIFGGKIFLATDDISHMSFATLVEDSRQEGIPPLWNPYIFCGMPTYGLGDRNFDLSSTLLNGISGFIGNFILRNQQNGWSMLYYLLMGVGAYLFAFRKLGSKIPALITALATIYSMYIIIWIMSGHGSKIVAMTFFPYVLLFVDRLSEPPAGTLTNRGGFSLPDVLLLILVLHFALVGAHVQMLFYIFLAVGLYFLFFILRGLIKKTEWKSAGKAAILFALATNLAFTMAADQYLSILEYNPSSMRGSAPITQSGQGTSATAEGGLDYDYATNWSLGVGELFTMVVPSLYGFGTHLYQGPLTNNQPYRLNTYFGPQPFTEAPQYMGIVVLVLAAIGFWQNRKVPFVQYLSLTIVFSLLIAFGKEFPLVYNLMYDFFPGFNKFRIPSMILVLVQMMVPILAGYGIVSLFRKREQPLTPVAEKRFKYVLATIAGLFLVGLLFRGFFAGVYEAFFPLREISQALARRGYNPQVAYKMITDLVVTDVVVAFGLLTLTFGALYLYYRKAMKLSTLSVLITLAVVIDLWRVNTKPMETREKSMSQQVFAQPEYVGILKQDSTLFRVLEFENGVPPYNNKLAYWRIQSAYGYHGAKMRRYQDMIDVAGVRNPLLWQLMNVKYIITDQPDSSRWMGLLYDSPTTKVYVNRTVLPRAFFVNRYEVGDGLPILQKIASQAFNPRDVAYLAEDPKITIDPPLPGMHASFTRYGIQDFTIEATTRGTNLLFISESYYPEGWKALLNGSEVPIYRANYHFRAVVLPPGKNVLQMKFEPRSFYLGKNLSLAVNVLLLGGLAFFGVRQGIQTLRKQKPAEPSSG